MSTTQTSNHMYTLSNTIQLVDINHNIPNFKAQFMISSQSNTPFEAVVVNQDQVDNNDFEFQNSSESGTFGGEIVLDGEEHDSYYIAMKSNEENIVNVNIQLDPLEVVDTSESTYSTVVKVLIGALLAIGIIGIVYAFNSKGQTQVHATQTPAPIAQVSSPSPVASTPALETSAGSKRESLLEKLRNVNVE